MKNIKKEIEEELGKLAPSLSKLEKKEGYDVPGDYFNQLPDDIMKQLDFPKISTEERAVSWTDILLEKIAILFQPRIAVGFAMAILFLFSINFLTKNTTSSSTVVPLAQISLDEIENYIDENIEDFEDESLFELVAEIEESNLNALDVEEEDLDEYMNEIIDDLDDSDLEELL